MKKEKLKKKKSKRYKVLCRLLFIITVLFIYLIININILSIKYLIPVVAILLLIVILDIVLINKKKILALLIGLLLVPLELIGCFYLMKTNDFFSKILHNTDIDVYKVVILKNTYNSLNEIESIGILNREDTNYKNALDKIEKTINKTITYTDSTSLIDALLNKDVPSILIDDATDNLYRENDENYNNLTVSIDDIEIKVKKEMTNESVDVTKDTYNIYISGVDTYGYISSKTRSDVNIIVTINPVSKKIVMVHIPRDYYVTLSGLDSKDKLTHSSLYGIETTVKTLEDLFNIDISYYIRINFTCMKDLVDALGGIDVESKYSFDTDIYDSTMTKKYHFKKGLNHLDGDMALSFVRERHSFNNGDITRGENQLLVLEAMINKALSSKIITNYTKYLDILDDKMITNLSKDTITTIVKNELNNLSSYDIESISLDGTDSYEYTYSYPKSKLYVMLPDEEGINNYKSIISSIKES